MQGNNIHMFKELFTE